MDTNLNNKIDQINTEERAIDSPARTFKDVLGEEIVNVAQLPSSTKVLDGGTIIDVPTFINLELNDIGCIDDDAAEELLEMMSEQNYPVDYQAELKDYLVVDLGDED